MRPIIIRTEANAERANDQARELLTELRGGDLSPAVLWALDDVNLPEKIDARVRNWIGEIRSAAPGEALALERLIDAYRALVVLYLGAFRYKPYWPRSEARLGCIPNLEMTERTPSTPVQQMQLTVAHLALALHGERARQPIHDAVMSERDMLRRIAELAADKAGRGPRPH